MGCKGRLCNDQAQRRLHLSSRAQKSPQKHRLPGGSVSSQSPCLGASSAPSLASKTQQNAGRCYGLEFSIYACPLDQGCQVCAAHLVGVTLKGDTFFHHSWGHEGHRGQAEQETSSRRRHRIIACKVRPERRTERQSRQRNHPSKGSEEVRGQRHLSLPLLLKPRMQIGLWGKAEGAAGPTEVSVANLVATLGSRKAWGWKDNLHLVRQKGFE